VPHAVDGRVAGAAVVDLLSLSHPLSASAATRPRAVNE
jgi:hypothetical protein